MSASTEVTLVGDNDRSGVFLFHRTDPREEVDCDYCGRINLIWVHENEDDESVICLDCVLDELNGD